MLFFSGKCYGQIDDNSDSWVKANISGYDMKEGIITETSETLQHVPGDNDDVVGMELFRTGVWCIV